MRLRGALGDQGHQAVRLGGALQGEAPGPAGGGAGVGPPDAAVQPAELGDLLLRAHPRVPGELHHLLPDGLLSHRGHRLPSPGSVQPPAVPDPGPADADPEHHQRESLPEASPGLPRRRGQAGAPGRGAGPGRGGARGEGGLQVGSRRRGGGGLGRGLSAGAARRVALDPAGSARGGRGEGGQREDQPAAGRPRRDGLLAREGSDRGFFRVHRPGALDPERFAAGQRAVQRAV